LIRNEIARPGGHCWPRKLAWYMESMATIFSALSDGDLLARLEHACAQERLATAQLVALLAEVDVRKLYAQQSCSSLFTYCVQVLHFSEHAAYLRIEAARAARRFPVILDRLAGGALHLTAVSLLAPHLTDENHQQLLDAARHRSKRDVEQLIAQVRPKPDAPTVVRKLPTSQTVASPRIELRVDIGEEQKAEPLSASTVVTATPAKRAEIMALAPERFKVQFTVERSTFEKLRQIQDLLRHSIPSGDPALIFDRALTLLLADLSKIKFAATNRPHAARKAKSGSRHVPAAVKREVWRRDEGRCAFRGDQGRCRETGFLEFHHVVPYAQGGTTTSENLELRCRTHNVYEAEQQFPHRAQPLFAREPRTKLRVPAVNSVRTERAEPSSG